MPVLIDARVEGANVMLPLFVTFLWPLFVCLRISVCRRHRRLLTTFSSPRRLFVATGQAN